MYEYKVANSNTLQFQISKLPLFCMSNKFFRIGEVCKWMFGIMNLICFRINLLRFLPGRPSTNFIKYINGVDTDSIVYDPFRRDQELQGLACYRSNRQCALRMCTREHEETLMCLATLCIHVDEASQERLPTGCLTSPNHLTDLVAHRVCYNLGPFQIESAPKRKVYLLL